MSSCRYFFLGGVLGLAFGAAPASLRADDAPANPNAPEVLARGPIHEAYAEPLEQQPAATAVVAKVPPNPIDELPPDQKPAGDHVVWVPGYWSYDSDREDFIWVSGFWRATPPGKVWMPGSWRKLDNGSQWVPGFWAPAQQDTAHQVQYLPQPPAPVDVGPATPAPTPTAIYVPGAWIYRDGRYVWRPGYWIEYKPNWIWIPAHYRWTPAGYVFIDGYWDYTLADRGMLFAPAYIPAGAYAQPGYYYQPQVVVRDQCVFGAMFVRRGYGCYYFGDYFEPRYADAGYVSWCGYSGGATVVVVRGWYDPMYSYYRVSYRDDPYWRGGMVELYVGRYRGDVPRPPVTLVQQNNIFIKNTTIVNNTTVINNKTVNVSQVQMLTTVSAAAKANPNMKMEPVSLAARQEHMKASREIHAAAVQRAHAETRLVAAHGGAMPRANEPPRSAKMEVAKTLQRSAAVTSSTNRTGTGNAATGVTGNGHPMTGVTGNGHPMTGVTGNGHPMTGVGHPTNGSIGPGHPATGAKIDPKSTTQPKTDKRPAPKKE